MTTHIRILPTKGTYHRPCYLSRSHYRCPGIVALRRSSYLVLGLASKIPQTCRPAVASWSNCQTDPKYIHSSGDLLYLEPPSRYLDRSFFPPLIIHNSSSFSSLRPQITTVARDNHCELTDAQFPSSLLTAMVRHAKYL